MLVVTRKIGEKILLFDAADRQIAEFVVIGIRGNYFRIGIGCPPDVTISREELVNRERASNDE